MAKHAPKSWWPERPDRRHLMARCPSFSYRLRIGIMGGSFNPAHEGHLYIAKEARRLAKLDEVWWLVSPQNPLKSAQNMADFPTRLTRARTLAGRNSWLRCLDLEQQLGLFNTFASLERLRQVCRHAELVWIMGADNLSQFPQWKRATDIARNTSILVMNRPNYGWQALASQGASLLGRRHRHKQARQLGRSYANGTGRGWVFHLHSHNPLSATLLSSRKTI